MLYLNGGYLRGVKFGRILRELGVSSYPLFMMYLMWDCSRVVCGGSSSSVVVVVVVMVVVVVVVAVVE